MSDAPLEQSSVRWRVVTVTFETMTSIAAPPSIVFVLSLSIDAHVASPTDRLLIGHLPN